MIIILFLTNIEFIINKFFKLYDTAMENFGK